MAEDHSIEKCKTETALVGKTERKNARKISAPSIVRLLEIERRWVLPLEQASLLLAQELWESEGFPAAPHELAALLERVLRMCVEEGMLYAPVLLLRKKSLLRGTWLPKAQATPTPASPHNVPAPQPLAIAAPPESTPAAAAHDGEECPRCSGTGLYASRDGLTGYLCPCGSYLRNLKLQKM
jgi:hypothetical protein